ncbi:hypothetical protein V5027_04055 [Enterobacter bugandensis]|jgi:hypothetical protein|uniref:hypothetical protein n=1 Tax=Enterobacter TaxID=547 RepID=UPI0020765C7E|nr:MULTISPECIES: hypothetical protein [Enterobacter]HDR2486713.1 hypothetical protein [Enterobacter ludwigii]MCM7236331.1 hypothetical protein [Enterobacter bugandensis]MCM7315834.1 hypothetical protein [Enterobacter bugandensis]MCM7351389.1 hypothetical protein [Enterobacter bugandensis]MDO2449438.1 hypothetical protein [Enterobacter vonholyi]
MMKQQIREVELVTKPLYLNGAHMGNVYYRIDFWGLNSPKNEAVAKRRLEELISQLQSDWKEF